MHLKTVACLAALVAASNSPLQSPVAAAVVPQVDHHQHLLSPTLAKAWSQPEPVTADRLIEQLDAAGIRRAVVLSLAYAHGSPAIRGNNEYARVRAENDWTAQQVSKYPDRLRAFCSINPLREYALREVDRCAKDPILRHGLKLHFGNSAIDYHNAQHVGRLREIFRAANQHRMAIVVHMRTSISRNIRYGRDEARIFLNEIVPSAPDVPIQVAHLAGAGGYSEPVVDQALGVFVEAIEKGDARTKQLYFDLTTVARPDTPADQAKLIATRIRQLGVQRILYGSDMAIRGNATPDESWRAHRAKLGLTEAEFRTIADNVAPYAR